MPVWQPDTPSTGWTPEAAFAAACEYALAVSFSGADTSRMTKVAYVALMNALPPKVKRAEIVDRVTGVDRFRESFQSSREVSDDAAPF
jgi:hypothetical protein